MQLTNETLVSMLEKEAETHPDLPLFLVKRDGQWQPTSRSEFRSEVLHLAAALISRGLEAGDRVGILAENSVDWAAADFAVMSMGGISVTLHASLTPEQVREQFSDCTPSACFVSTADQRDKLLSVLHHLPSIRLVIAMNSDAAAGDVVALSALREEGQALGEGGLRRVIGRSDALTPDDIACICYTSGTTGESKGVVLTHGNLTRNVRAMEPAYPGDPGDIVLSYLPLSHIYARTCDLYMGLGTQRTLAMAESFDRLFHNMAEVRPHSMAGVPRIHQKIVELAQQREEAGVEDPLRTLLGGRVRWISSGGAALPPAMAQYYWDHGVMLFQGYGLTETSPVISFSSEHANRIGASGKPIPGVEVKIAEDGEILTRGHHVMRGYWNRPQATAEAIDPEGWFHTGDIGCLDEDGFLFITDRKKEIIVTSYGKNVAPQRLEGLLVADPLIEQAMVYGDDRPFLTAIIVPARAPLAEWAKQEGFSQQGEALLKDPAVAAEFEHRIHERLASLSHYEQVGRFLLRWEPFSVEAGELTLTAKLRRKQITERHREELDALYEGH